jgi:hypothetical protein
MLVEIENITYIYKEKKGENIQWLKSRLAIQGAAVILGRHAWIRFKLYLIG